MVQRIETSNFNYHGETRTFTQDASTLGVDLFATMFQELIPEESYQGFILVSERTGDEQPLHLEGRVRDAEGDIQFWRFKPGFPGQANFTELLVWND